MDESSALRIDIGIARETMMKGIVNELEDVFAVDIVNDLNRFALQPQRTLLKSKWLDKSLYSGSRKDKFQLLQSLP